MSFKNAEIKKQANIYDGGKVTSRAVTTADSKTLTLGIMLPGTYSFNTAAAEIMELQSGTCRIRQQGESHWSEYAGGESFNVPANSSFDIEVTEVLDYICYFE
jgi:uncharacterized protein YaiE (UPF0345 family)